MYRFCVVLIAAAAAGTAKCQNTKLLADDKLQTPVTIQAKNTSITDFLKLMSAKTSAKLTVPASLQNLKVTVFVEAEPAAKVLDRVADVLMCDWNSTDDGGYRLNFPNEMLSYRNIYLDREEQFYHASLVKQMTAITKETSVPYRTLLMQQAQLDALLRPADARLQPNPTQKQQIEKEYDLLRPKLDPERYALGSLFRALTPTTLSRFWTGYAMTTTLPSAQPARRPQNTPNSESAEPTLLFVKYDRSRILTSGSITLNEVNSVASDFVQGVPRTLIQFPYAKSVLDWTKRETSKAKPFGGPVQVDTSGSLADALETVFESTKAPIVAQGSRRLIHVKASGESPESFAASLMRDTMAYARVGGGYLEVRYPRFWQVERAEIPESKYQKIEKDVADSKLTLDSYADFVADLTPLQEEGLRDHPIVALFPTSHFRSSLPGLVAYGHLKASARAAAKQELGYQYNLMDVIQREKFGQAVFEFPFASDGDRKALARQAFTVIQLSTDPRALRTFSLSVTSTDGQTSTIKLGTTRGAVEYHVPVPVGG